jgi:hypothetical protein
MAQSLRHKATALDAPKTKVAAVRKLSVNARVAPVPHGSVRAGATE